MNAGLPSALMRVRLQLMLRHPYLAAAIARFPLHEASDQHWCQTAATDGYNIFVNSRFFAGLSEEESLAVLAHEVLHCILGHMDRRGERHLFGWNVAIDLATNLLLVERGFKLPAGSLCKGKFKGMTAEDIYDRIPAERRRIYLADGRLDESKKAGLDVHLDPNGILGRQFRGSDFPTEYERRRLRSYLAGELRSKLPRHAAGWIAQEIDLLGRARIPWREILARFIQGIRLDDYCMYPFNKKHVWQGLCLPSMRTPGPAHIVVAVDTSGSMEDDTLASLLAEIDSLRSLITCSMTLIQCDDAIRSIKHYEAWEVASADFRRLRFKGRGGTSLVPPFEWIITQGKENPILPDALVYFTDGFGDFPDREPPIPCLWIVPEEGLKEFPFGHRLPFPKHGIGTSLPVKRS